MNKPPGFFDYKNAKNVLTWRRKLIEYGPNVVVIERFHVDHITSMMHVYETPTCMRKHKPETCMFFVKQAS